MVRKARRISLTSISVIPGRRQLNWWKRNFGDEHRASNAECVWLSERIKLEGISVSLPTFQSILNENYLGLKQIVHCQSKVWCSQTNGFQERSNGTILDEFIRLAFRTNFMASKMPHGRIWMLGWCIRILNARIYRRIRRHQMDTIQDCLNSAQNETSFYNKEMWPSRKNKRWHAFTVSRNTGLMSIKLKCTL